MTWKPALAAVALVLLTGPAAAPAGFRAPVPLGELIGTADAITVGTVRSVRAESFSFKVEEELRGLAGRQLLRIAKLPPDEESPRWTAYRAGEELLLFLQHGAGWQVAGRIGEGEIALDRSYAYFPGRFLGFLTPDYYSVHGAKTYLQRIERATLMDAVRGYLRCFSWEPTAAGPRRPRAVCSADDLAAYRARSALHDFLVRETGLGTAACSGSERARVGHARETPARILIRAHRSGLRICHGHRVLHIGQCAEEEPEVVIEPTAVEHLHDQLDIGGVEEPERSRLAAERPRAAALTW